MYLNRIVCITRDVLNGTLYDVSAHDWKTDIMETYDWIKAVRKENYLFRSI